MHGAHSSEDEPMAEMNLVPLIDIALTLVIILMVTTAFIQKPGVALKLPETVTREGAAETKKDLTVVIAADGSFYFDGAKQTKAEIQTRLNTISAHDRMARVLIKADRDVYYGHVMEVMDMARQAKLTHLVFPTLPQPIGAQGGMGTASVAPAASPTP